MLKDYEDRLQAATAVSLNLRALLLPRLRRWSAELVSSLVLQFATTDWGVRLLYFCNVSRSRCETSIIHFGLHHLLLQFLLRKIIIRLSPWVKQKLRSLLTSAREEDSVTESGLVASLKFFDDYNYNHRGGRKSLRGMSEDGGMVVG